MPAEIPADAIERVRAILEASVSALGAEGTVSVARDGETVSAVIETDDAGPLIGRHGRTLDALGVVCGQAARLADETVERVEVDAGGYREHRRETVAAIADRAADRALATGEEIALDPMPASERRIVHEHLRDRSGVDTFSAGEGSERHTVVAPLT